MGYKYKRPEAKITVDGKTLQIYKEPDAANLPWGELKIDVVLECTGFYTKKEKAELIERLEKQMKDAARRLEFEEAAYIRDRIRELREQK